jgi:predicted AAA+ superfamily ATPase
MIIIHVMNRLHYRPRALAPAVEEALGAHPVVVVSGARQTGKTTLVQNLPSSSQRSFETLDDLETLELARKRPEDLLARAPRLTIDEVQRVPELLLAIKRNVDKRRQRGRFLLTGSANLLLMREVADSLSGRAVYLLLSPFTGGEKRGEGSVPPWDAVLSCRHAGGVLESLAEQQTHKVDWPREILRGGMPRAVLSRSARERDAWFEGFVTTYLERDLRDISQVSSLPDFRRLMGLAVHRVGQLLNQTELARDAGLSQATAHRYLNLLETTFQTHRLPAYSASPAKRLIKSPKLYWRDAGLAAHLAGLQGLKDLRASRLAGSLLENLVLAALLAWRETARPKPELNFWRTAGGAEIDFVIESQRRLVPIEVKASKRVRLDDLRHIEIFLSDHAERALFGAILHDTNQAHMITRQIVGLPVSEFV